MKFVSVMSYSFTGQSFLEGIQSQLLLNNVESNPARLEYIHKTRPESGHSLIDVLTYNGRHVVIQGIHFNSNGVRIESEFKAEWENEVETAFDYLD